MLLVLNLMFFVFSYMCQNHILLYILLVCCMFGCVLMLCCPFGVKIVFFTMLCIFTKTIFNLQHLSFAIFNAFMFCSCFTVHLQFLLTIILNNFS